MVRWVGVLHGKEDQQHTDNTHTHLALIHFIRNYTELCTVYNDVSTFISTEAQSEISVSANSVRGECSTGHL